MIRMLKGIMYSTARLYSILHEMYLADCINYNPNNITKYGTGYIENNTLYIDDTSEYYEHMPMVHKKRLQQDIGEMYLDYASLSANETEYIIEVEDRKSDVTVIAIHGGKMERGSDLLAKRIAELGGYNYYAFKGNKTSNNMNLHITSTNFDEPSCVELVERSNTVISIHGYADTIDNTYIGGLDTDLISTATAELQKANFTVSTGRFAGVEQNNIANQGRMNKGLQLELSTSLRDKMITNEVIINIYANAICELKQ